MNANGRLVGQSPPRSDARDKVTGAAKYAADLRAPDMLFAIVVRSPHPHARITFVDPASSLALPGVRTVLTSADVAGEVRYGAPHRDHPVLALERVRYVGDAVALVAAETQQAAEDAGRALRVAYEPLAAVFDADEAMAPGAPTLHGCTNLLAEHHVEKGDLEKGFANAVLVAEDTYECSRQVHAYIEPEAVLAVPDGGQRVTILAPMQNPFAVRKVVAETLGWEPAQVRVVQAETGGSFGGKNDFMYQTCAQAALLAVACRRPVMLRLPREESMQASNKRHPMRIHHRTGVDSQGLICAADITILADGGAYSATSPSVLWRAVVHAAGPYVAPNVRVVGRVCYTNNPPSGAMRGFGGPQAMLAADLQMDLLARKARLDPLEFRRRNALRKGSRTITGHRLDGSVGLLQTMDRAAAAVCWRWPRARRRNGGPVRRGLGIACAYHGVSVGVEEGRDTASARLWVSEDGVVHAATGVTDLGTGTRTSHAQILADVLGLAPGQVCIEPSDTSLCPESGRTVSSRGTYMGGNALIVAAEQLKRRLAEVVAEAWGIDPPAVQYQKGRVRQLTAEGSEVDLAGMAQIAAARGSLLEVTGTYASPDAAWNERTGQGSAYPAYGFATCAAEVAVDTTTGKVDVLRIVTAADAGRAINPDAVHGQLAGGAVMGLGYALLEDADAQGGRLRNLNLDSYLIPTALDSPQIDCIVVEDPEPSGPMGAKGIAELAMLGVAPAILNAIADATGRRIRALPATLEQVLLGRTLRRG